MFNDDGTLTANFTRVEVFGSEDNSWIEMTEDPSSENVFSFGQVNLQLQQNPAAACGSWRRHRSGAAVRCSCRYSVQLTDTIQFCSIPL